MRAVVLGAGRMGRAAAWDLARQPGMERVTLADRDATALEHAAKLGSHKSQHVGAARESEAFRPSELAAAPAWFGRSRSAAAPSRVAMGILRRRGSVRGLIAEHGGAHLAGIGARDQRVHVCTRVSARPIATNGRTSATPRRSCGAAGRGLAQPARGSCGDPRRGRWCAFAPRCDSDTQDACGATARTGRRRRYCGDGVSVDIDCSGRARVLVREPVGHDVARHRSVLDSTARDLESCRSVARRHEPVVADLDEARRQRVIEEASQKFLRVVDMNATPVADARHFAASEARSTGRDSCAPTCAPPAALREAPAELHSQNASVAAGKSKRAFLRETKLMPTASNTGYLIGTALSHTGPTQ